MLPFDAKVCRTVSTQAMSPSFAIDVSVAKVLWDNVVLTAMVMVKANRPGGPVMRQVLF